MALTLHQRRKRFALTSASGLLLLAVIVILLNLLANFGFLRWDMTERKAYSLTPASRALVRELDDRVIVKAYFTPDLPSPYNTYARYARDLLTEYRAASKGRVKYEFVLANPPQDFERKAAEAGLMPIQFQQVGSDQFQVRRGFMGLVMFYRDKSETIPVIRSVEGLEYDLTTKLARMARKNKKSVAFTAGHGETEWRLPQSRLAQDLQELYNINAVNLPLPATGQIQADALVVVGPTQKLDDQSLFAIDQAIMKGIPTAFLVDTKNLNARQFMALPLETGLKPLLAHYGIALKDELVYDAQCQTVTMTQNAGGFALQTAIPYPYLLMVSGFPKDHPITRDLDSVVVPFATTVDISSAAVGLAMTPLLQSSPRSWLAPPNTMRISPDAVPQPTAEMPRGPYPVGALYEGTFTSYFQGKPVPVQGQPVVSASPKTQIFVLGTSHVLNPDLPGFPGTDAFIANLFAFLAKDETLLGVHPKGDLLRPLKPVTNNTKDFFKVLCLLGVPLLAAALGIFLWRRRKAWRASTEAAFAPPARPQPTPTPTPESPEAGA
jgi:gliding-associated putative ABC transporter substrate-binding component GldG